MSAPSALLDLQTLDVAIDRLIARERGLREGEALTAARREADEAERVQGELGLERDALDRDGGKLEHDIDSLSQKADAEQRRMSDGSVANARELEAMGREIDNLRRRIAEREDELLVVMERREDVERRSAAATTTADQLRQRVHVVATDATVELEEVVRELDAKREERERLAGGIDAETLELYEELRAHKRGVGAAALIDGVCQGCHETLSAAELDRVKHTDGVARCEHCRRILVL